VEKAVTATIQPDTILRELAELWVSLGKEKEAEGETSAGVLRACAMTLVTAAEESEDASAIGETVAALMREHPSRAIVIRLRAGADRALEARVFAQCWMPFGQRRQICCEQIEIVASDLSLSDLPAVIVPLAAADLPVVLWCRNPRILHLPGFAQLAGVAQKMIFDSALFPDPRAVLTNAVSRLSAPYALADLAWTRLTRSRELVSQIFDNRSHLESLPRISEIHISFGGADPPVAAYYLGAWLLDSLESAGARPKLIWEANDGEVGKLHKIALVAADFGVHLEMQGSAVDVSVDHLTARTKLAGASDYDLLREELAIPYRDPIFEKTLARAARLVQ
jgi:glucose-6-phosphate dehydrogenase assembly protein OpcA